MFSERMSQDADQTCSQGVICSIPESSKGRARRVCEVPRDMGPRGEVGSGLTLTLIAQHPRGHLKAGDSSM